MKEAEAVKIVIEKYPGSVARYRAGEKGLIGAFAGDAMLLMHGKADPKELVKLLKQELEK